MNFLKENLMKLGYEIDDYKLNQFKIYIDFLLEYNKNVNLTSITEPKEVIIKHFIDSIMINLKLEIPDNAKLIDVGTGAGFPGIPLKIINPSIDLTLVDSLNKRLIFLDKLLDLINLKAEIVHSRAEDLSKQPKYREKFDIATSRAVASLNVLSEYCIPFVKVHGNFIAMKGDNIETELNEAKNAITKLGCEIKEIKKFNLPDESNRSLIVITKRHPTNNIYPRSYSKIKKNPL